MKRFPMICVAALTALTVLSCGEEDGIFSDDKVTYTLEYSSDHSDEQIAEWERVGVIKEGFVTLSLSGTTVKANFNDKVRTQGTVITEGDVNVASNFLLDDAVVGEMEVRFDVLAIVNGRLRMSCDQAKKGSGHEDWLSMSFKGRRKN